MPYLPQERQVVIKPGGQIPAKTGERLIIVIPSSRCIADSHAHIENGACVPLPLAWNRPWVPDVERTMLDMLTKIAKPAAGKVQVKSTTEIGNRAAKELDSAFGPESPIGKSDFYQNCDLFSFAVILMMDMEYGWISGFDGLTIYQEDETPWYYYKRQNARDPKEKWQKAPLPGENQKTFACWKKQLDETAAALRKNPLRIIGMYHYDPRRWNFPKSQKYDELRIKGAWSHPFNEIATSSGKGLFIGFKMYPPLGYKPLDPRLPYLHDLKKDADCFYARCEREGIPILAHCSPGGIYTHELKLYREYDSGVPQYRINPSSSSSKPADASYVSGDNQNIAMKYFWDNYVHPLEWRKVLQKFPKLRLCLAHFGGDEWKKGPESDWITEIVALTKEYPNVYTDFACWDLDYAKESFAQILKNRRYSHLRDKILFGTDWYMTLLVLDGKSYKSFCEEFMEFFLELPDGKELWQRFTFINPFRFYGFFDKKEGEQRDKLDNLAAALELNDCKRDRMKDNYACLRRVQKEYEKVKNQGGSQP
jgi:predicted TIM-barrel fold metal-dependent hydrolase